jgi:hypothetical protein
MPFAKMLASSSAHRGSSPAGGHSERSATGSEIIVAVDATVRIWTRRGHDLSEQLPELAALADVVDVPVMLDGELVAGQGARATSTACCPRSHREDDEPQGCRERGFTPYG